MKTHLLFIVGPTACGKSALAVEASEKSSAVTPEIINCDSVQFYEGLDIGAAKPEPVLLKRVRHHLIGHVPLGSVYNAGDFRRDSLQLIEARGAAGVTRFVSVGGSGFYVQALEKGMYEVPQVDPLTRTALEQEAMTQAGLVRLYSELQSRDPEAASKIKPKDRYRIARALEILRSHPLSGTVTQIRAQFAGADKTPPFVVHKIGLFRPRPILRQRVRERVEQMLAAGLIDEVESLRARLSAKGVAAWAPLRSVGYREVQEFLDGQLARSALVDAIETSTMQLAKRQMTWFKRDPSITWFDVENGLAAPRDFALQILASGLQL